MTERQMNATEHVDDLLEIGLPDDEVFWAVGGNYAALRLQFKRRGRMDLVERLRVWRERDIERLKRAQGKSWW